MILSSPVKSSIDYSPATVERAERALLCSPFLLKTFATMLTDSVSLLSMAGRTGVDKGYTVAPISETRAEKQLTWLIKVGILRREVDGQGITDSFRLTPLGRILVDRWRSIGSLPKPTLRQRAVNWFTRLFAF